MRNAGAILGFVLAAALGACAQHHPQSAAAKNPATAAARGVAATCPLAQLRNLRASVTDTPDGVAITFAGPRDDRDQIRDNVHAMADANDKHGDAFASCPCGRAPSAGAAEAQGAYPYQGGRTSMQPTPRTPIAADASVDNTTTGAVLKLKAKNKGEIGALRNQVHEDVHGVLTECRRQAVKGGGEPEYP
jgi:hypothetical protein